MKNETNIYHDDDDDDDVRPSQAKTTTTSIPGFCGCEDG